MVERYGAEEIQGTDGPPEFYFQTHGAEPGELKELLDRICGPGQYALKVRPAVVLMFTLGIFVAVKWD